MEVEVLAEPLPRVSVTSLVASQSHRRSLAVEHVSHLRLHRHTTIFWFVCVYPCVCVRPFSSSNQDSTLD